MTLLFGERGVKLSGGQRQRVAIARMLAKEPSMIICDEATNQMDSINESIITESLEEMSAGKTTIIIAHRLSTILSADGILVIAKGRLVGMGTHRELYENCERYRVLVGSQVNALKKLELAQMKTNSL